MNNAKDDPIRHVILLILENHSFDQMMGSLKPIYPNMDGIDAGNLRSNADRSGKLFHQSESTERQVILDPHHEVDHVSVQLADGNSGFVQDYETSFPQATGQDKQYIMDYYPLDFLPALHGLGRAFTVCDHWFASLPGPTWPNRFFALTGTSSDRTDMPDDGDHKLDLLGYVEQQQDTIFDRLNDAGIDWKIYFHDLPQSLVLWHQREAKNAAKYFPIDDFYNDVRSNKLPLFSYVEPRYNGEDQNDDHPPHDIMKAQRLIADVYNAIRQSDLWNSTLLIVFYDEHGGFYDHVTPPSAVPPDAASSAECFRSLGVRVPALLISPWVEATLFQETLDHTSVLKYLSDKWGLSPLGERAQRAKSFASAIRSDWNTPRTDTPIAITLTADQLSPPDPSVEKQAAKFKNAHQVALIMFAHYLEVHGDSDAPKVLSTIERDRWILAAIFPVLALGFIDSSILDRATRNVNAFLDRQKALVARQAGA
jgi:phospholipase C